MKVEYCIIKDKLKKIVLFFEEKYCFCKMDEICLFQRNSKTQESYFLTKGLGEKYDCMFLVRDF